MPKWIAQTNVDAFYGNPRGRNGSASPTWERANLTIIPAPWKLVTSWDGTLVRGIRIHQLCANSLQTVLESIWKASGQDEKQIRAWGMHLYGGGYNYRLMRGSNQLSMHAWGCAVDFDPAKNGFGDSTPAFANHKPVLKAFADEGWTWGGRWAKPDGMHWQAADI
jgi:hypothetical protein